MPDILGDPEFYARLQQPFIMRSGEDRAAAVAAIKISAEGDSPYVDFEVSDTGPGISGENLTHIFEPYFSTKETGTGLGLAIVSKIVDIHNGEISVESIEGEGTRFIVKLPKA